MREHLPKVWCAQKISLQITRKIRLHIKSIENIIRENSKPPKIYA